jgi:signal transduction histidine kinase
MMASVRDLLRSNLARLVLVNLFSMTVLIITFAVVMETFSGLRQLFQSEVSHKAEMAAKSFTIGKAFVILESELHSLHSSYLHDPEGIIANSKKLLTRFDALIMEAKTTENFLRYSHGVKALANYRQSLSLLLDDEIRVSQSTLDLELRNLLFLQTLTQIEEHVGQLIMEQVLTGNQTTGLMQINALIPFCREQVLQARLLTDQAVYDQNPTLLSDPSGPAEKLTLSVVIANLQQTMATMTAAPPSVTRQTDTILSQIRDYQQKVQDLGTALRSTIHNREGSTRTRDEIVNLLNQVDQQTVTSLDKVGEASTLMLARTTRTIYSVTALVLVVSIIGGLLVHIIGRQLALSAKTAEEARTALHAQVVRLDAEIAGRAQAESEVRQLNDHLDLMIKERTRELATANHELEAFVTAMSHDLRTPLRGIAGFTHALGEEYGPHLEAQGQAYLARVQEACLRVGTTIDSLLELSRLSRCVLTVAEVDLGAMAESVLAELRRNEPGREIMVTIAPTPTILADPTMMRALLSPLLANAWKFTRPTANAAIAFGSERQEQRLTFFVKDNGVGFNMAYRGKLFQPFQRLHSPDQFPGLGIGLATAKRIVNRYRGEIRANSREGEGAMVAFTLPEAKSKA